MSKFAVNDVVRGNSNNYCITDYAMTRAKVVEVSEDGKQIVIKVLQHSTMAYEVGSCYTVEAKDFIHIGHLREFVREEFMEKIAKGDLNIITEMDLYGADLSGANLRSADLSGANLVDVRYDEYTAFFALVCPEEGAFIGFKVCRSNLIVKLRITEDAERSSATSRKCRCSKAEVISIMTFDGKEVKEGVAYSKRDSSFEYRVGKTVEVSNFDKNRWNECSTGIHFFMTKQEAINYDY